MATPPPEYHEYHIAPGGSEKGDRRTEHLRFSVDLDIYLLKLVIEHNPYDAPHGTMKSVWNNVAVEFNSMLISNNRGSRVSARSVRERTSNILKKCRAYDPRSSDDLLSRNTTEYLNLVAKLRSMKKRKKAKLWEDSTQCFEMKPASPVKKPIDSILPREEKQENITLPSISAIEENLAAANAVQQYSPDGMIIVPYNTFAQLKKNLATQQETNKRLSTRIEELTQELESFKSRMLRPPQISGMFHLHPVS